MKKIKIADKYALVDDEDYSYLKDLSWYFHNRRDYPMAWYKGHNRIELMHRIVMGCPAGMQIDHINNNPLDNRKRNLRICSCAENLKNSSMRPNNKSGYKGVCWHKSTKRWEASVLCEGKKVRKYFNDKKEAAKGYNELALYYYGDFASLNKV
jgi:hypothetical protein